MSAIEQQPGGDSGEHQREIDLPERQRVPQPGERQGVDVHVPRQMGHELFAAAGAVGQHLPIARRRGHPAGDQPLGERLHLTRDAKDEKESSSEERKPDAASAAKK